MCYSISDDFDCVLMLTWSDWDKEAISNRFHYATRFADHLPVLFFQHKNTISSEVQVVDTQYENIELVNVSVQLTLRDVSTIKKILRARGYRRPLVWVYDPINYKSLIESLSAGFRVYHATEDYFTDTKVWEDGIQDIRKSLRWILPRVDMVVACSSGVANSYARAIPAIKNMQVIENGCDLDFIDSVVPETVIRRDSDKIAVYQGGVNDRLDFGMIRTLVESLEDWTFKFIGEETTRNIDWKAIKELPNVIYLGALDRKSLYFELKSSAVGLIPFYVDEWIKNSLPLKAFEYVACDLPVVSVPIDALQKHPDIFAIASNSDEFAQQIVKLQFVSNDGQAKKLRRKVAQENSYNSRFNALLVKIEDEINKSNQKSANIAFLYDAGAVETKTVQEHVAAFTKYSSSRIFNIPCSIYDWQALSADPGEVDFSSFDCVVLHYSIRLSIVGHLQEKFFNKMRNFDGIKILFIQDEYENTERARSYIETLGFDIVYTCVPEDYIEKVYPCYRFPGTEFINNLTGYVPESPGIEDFGIPLGQREIRIGYRGRRLPPIYGQLGYDKYVIGEQVKKLAQEKAVSIDIEVDDQFRIYGDQWYRFLGSCRATLGTESGSNVFDFDGGISDQLKKMSERLSPDCYYNQALELVSSVEGEIVMNQVSPKIFEAIKLRTALVLFEGEYSGVVRPWEHYIPLKKDFSNIYEVLDLLENQEFLESMTAKAHEDVIGTGRYSYKTFVEDFDRVISRYIRWPKENNIFALYVDQVPGDNAVKQIMPPLPLGVVDRKELLVNISKIHYKKSGGWLTIKIPSINRKNIKYVIRKYIVGTIQNNKCLYAVCRAVWQRMPAKIKEKMVTKIL